MAAAGRRAVMLFLIQIGSARRFALARDIDPGYGKAFDAARARGRRGHRLSLRHHLRGHRGGRAGADRGVMRPGSFRRHARACPTASRHPGDPDALASHASLLTLRRNSGMDGRQEAARPQALMSYVDAALAPQRKTGQIKLHGPAAFEGMRKAGRLVGRVPRHARRRDQARRADREDRPAGLRIRHGPQGDAGDADVSRLPESHLHLGQPRRLPRHPLREAAQGRRHRQCRRHADPRRLARRFQPHVCRGRDPAPGRAADRGHLRGDDARHLR